MNSQDSNRKSKAKKPNHRIRENGWKENAPQTSKISCTDLSAPGVQGDGGHDGGTLLLQDAQDGSPGLLDTPSLQ